MTQSMGLTTSQSLPRPQHERRLCHLAHPQRAKGPGGQRCVKGCTCAASPGPGVPRLPPPPCLFFPVTSLPSSPRPVFPVTPETSFADVQHQVERVPRRRRVLRCVHGADHPSLLRGVLDKPSGDPCPAGAREAFRGKRCDFCLQRPATAPKPTLDC